MELHEQSQEIVNWVVEMRTLHQTLSLELRFNYGWVYEKLEWRLIEFNFPNWRSNRNHGFISQLKKLPRTYTDFWILASEPSKNIQTRRRQSFLNKSFSICVTVQIENVLNLTKVSFKSTKWIFSISRLSSHSIWNILSCTIHVGERWRCENGKIYYIRLALTSWYPSFYLSIYGHVRTTWSVGKCFCSSSFPFSDARWNC